MLHIYHKNTTISEKELYIVRSNSNPFTYLTNVPKDANIKIFIENENTNYMLYSYNETNNSYDLVNEKLTNESGYISFKSTGSNKYIISSEIIKNDVIKESSNVSNIIYFVLGAIIASGILLGIYFYLNNKKGKNNINNYNNDTNNQVENNVNNYNNDTNNQVENYYN